MRTKQRRELAFEFFKHLVPIPPSFHRPDVPLLKVALEISIELAEMLLGDDAVDQMPKATSDQDTIFRTLGEQLSRPRNADNGLGTQRVNARPCTNCGAVICGAPSVENIYFTSLCRFCARVMAQQGIAAEPALKPEGVVRDADSPKGAE